MNSRERLLTAIDCKIPDRVPVSTYELVGYNSRAFENQDPSYQRLMQVIREKTDCMCMWEPGSDAILPKSDHVGDFLETTAHPVEMELRQNVTDSFVESFSTLHTPQGPLTRATKVFNNIHTVWKTEHWCKDTADVDRILSIPYKPVTYDFSDLPRIKQEVGDNGIIMTSVFDALGWCVELMELSHSLLWAMIETDHFARSVEIVHERVMENLRRMLDANVVDFYRICGPEYATPPYMAPDLFHRFVTPCVKEMVELIHSKGARVRVHSHGKIGEVLGMIAETGADGIDPCEEPPDGDITLDEVKRQVGGRMCLFGSVQLKMLEHGSKEQIEQVVRRNMAAAKAGGGYVIMPTAAPINTPLAPKTEENYLHYIDTALQYGQYD